MSNAIKQASYLKFALLGITLVTAAVISQSNSVSFTSASNSVSMAGSEDVVQVKRFDTPSVTKLWSDYESLFLAQQQGINQSFFAVETATLEIEQLVAEIDQEMSDFLVSEAGVDPDSGTFQLGFATLAQKSL